MRILGRSHRQDIALNNYELDAPFLDECERSAQRIFMRYARRIAELPDTRSMDPLPHDIDTT